MNIYLIWSIIWGVIFILDLSAFIIYIYLYNHNKIKDISESALFLFLVITIVSLPISIALGVQDYRYSNEIDEYLYTEIYSLDRDNEVSAHFALGCGSIETTQYYYFYTLTDCGYKLEKISSKDTYLVIDDSVTPSIKHYKLKNSVEEYNVIYCPTGTIQQQFNG